VPSEHLGPTLPTAAGDPSGPGPDSSWQRPQVPAGTGPPEVPLRPAVLSRLRLDPGRRGAAALVVVALVAALAAGAVVLRGRPQEVAAPDVVARGVALPGPTATSSPGAQAADVVVVAVAGKVARPGLVRLPAGSRVDDALRAAGGPLPGTDPGLLNLARRLVDGEQVLVGVDPPPAPPEAAGAGPVEGGPLDLNRATAADLDALPGIGPVLAQRIVDWRTEHGRFASIEQLREVTGIGESKYAELEDSVSVS
jgi:competence protein ComEA